MVLFLSAPRVRGTCSEQVLKYQETGRNRACNGGGGGVDGRCCVGVEDFCAHARWYAHMRMGVRARTAALAAVVRQREDDVAERQQAGVDLLACEDEAFGHGFQASLYLRRG